MTRDEIANIVKTTIAEEFSYDKEKISEQTVAADVPGWDSFSHGVLIMQIESEVKVELPVDKIMEAANVGELIDLINTELK
ncbi:acyl carrier protein [Parvularcula flava]|uniref:Acyl carrier protein n=1 Tax=Aquisalinus luteolus TaxID=1566827 RepID=A0A8J3A610_9PROT|nr:acyl carrier protein [Aquisalinus luteolus]NHK29517.1 acyl carrier protein [Aquisalinus luteolus]GGI01699.1 hypothetical protein GCM10011355_32970 [Aquisalinus luteolus]